MEEPAPSWESPTRQVASSNLASLLKIFAATEGPLSRASGLANDVATDPDINKNEFVRSLTVRPPPSSSPSLGPTAPTMTNPIKITRAANVEQSGPQSAGMIRKNALVDVSDQVCGTIMIAKPNTSSAIHHHGSEDTIIYAVRGTATLLTNGGTESVHLQAGDWALIPAFTEHQEANYGEDEVELVICRGGRVPIVENVEGWGKSKKDQGTK